MSGASKAEAGEENMRCGSVVLANRREVSGTLFKWSMRGCGKEKRLDFALVKSLRNDSGAEIGERWMPVHQLFLFDCFSCYLPCTNPFVM